MRYAKYQRAMLALATIGSLAFVAACSSVTDLLKPGSPIEMGPGAKNQAEAEAFFRSKLGDSQVTLMSVKPVRDEYPHLVPNYSAKWRAIIVGDLDARYLQVSGWHHPYLIGRSPRRATRIEVAYTPDLSRLVMLGTDERDVLDQGMAFYLSILPETLISTDFMHGNAKGRWPNGALKVSFTHRRTRKATEHTIPYAELPGYKLPLDATHLPAGDYETFQDYEYRYSGPSSDPVGNFMATGSLRVVLTPGVKRVRYWRYVNYLPDSVSYKADPASRSVTPTIQEFWHSAWGVAAPTIKAEPIKPEDVQLTEGKAGLRGFPLWKFTVTGLTDTFLIPALFTENGQEVVMRPSRVEAVFSQTEPSDIIQVRAYP